jgi:nucleoside-diphosphate-sugar epimerase
MHLYAENDKELTMILVTGATGSIGREVVKLLVDGSEPVVAVTRNPAAAALPKGARVVGGDPSHSGTLMSRRSSSARAPLGILLPEPPPPNY